MLFRKNRTRTCPAVVPLSGTKADDTDLTDFRGLFRSNAERRNEGNKQMCHSRGSGNLTVYALRAVDCFPDKPGQAVVPLLA